MKIENAASVNHLAQMLVLAEFAEADISYVDRGNGEDYTMTKNQQTVVLKVRGNHVDGGFLIIEAKSIPSVQWSPREQTNSAANKIIAQQADEMKGLQDGLDEAHAHTQKLAELLAMARCPECDGSGVVVSHVHADEYVSREMALDAGDPSMEGSIYRVGEPEFNQCQWCDEKKTALAAHEQRTEQP